MVVHGHADLQGDGDGVHHEAVAFELHLPARHVEAGDELLVGARRGMREDRLVELALDVTEVDVVHEDHRTLPDRRHRLVGRVGLVDAQAHLPRIRHQARLHQRLAGRLGAQLLLLPLIGGESIGAVEPFLERVGSAHGRAGAQEGRPVGEAGPGLVPQEDQVGLDGEAFLHHPAGVVHVPVEGAVGEVEHPHPVEPAFVAEVQQRLLDRLERDRAVHRILRQRERLDIGWLAAAEHEAVMVRLVAIAVDDDDVARPHERLHHHLVAGRRAVGDEEHVIGAEGPRRHVLRLLDVAGRLQQAVEAARGGAALGKKQVHAIEFAHVADPVRVEHGLAAGDRQGMERRDRPLRVLLQVVEEGRLVARRHALEDGQVQFHRLLDRVEDAAQDRRPWDRRRSPPRCGPRACRGRAPAACA